MYSFDEVNNSLENEKLSDALYKMGRFACAQGLTDLATWCDREFNGYADNQVDEVELDYRVMVVEWRDQDSNPIILPLNLSDLNTPLMLKGVSVLEDYAAGNAISYPLPDEIEVLNQNGVPAHIALIWPDQIQAWLNRIRRQARSRLHDKVPRVPGRKLVYPAPNFASLVADAELAKVLGQRWMEANLSFEAGAYLATVILLGTILEGVLLSKVEQNPAQANKASSCPKDKKSGQPLPFEYWKLQNLIEVAHECGWLKKQYKDFSHVVRDYRNFVHPNKERQEGVTFDANICKVVFEVVSAALS